MLHADGHASIKYSLNLVINSNQNVAECPIELIFDSKGVRRRKIVPLKWSMSSYSNFTILCALFEELVIPFLSVISLRINMLVIPHHEIHWLGIVTVEEANR